MRDDRQLTPLEALKKYWGYDAFRPLQEDIIHSILQGNDTLGLMPTGGGKSLTFQVPTMVRAGMALVVTPIISLMKDQVDNLIAHGIKASYLYAGLTMSEARRTLEKCRWGKVKFLYVSPERLQSDSFLENLKAMPITLLVVDEAHCISQWGYDFRPSYLKIAAIRDILPNVPLLALTASATRPVVNDIMDKLRFKTPNVFRQSFSRPNISYVVRTTEEKHGELVHILKSVPGSAIVYARSRKRTKLIADELKRHGINADFYHAGLLSEDKEERQNKWKSGECRVMVATTAFGMGIDKPDVRLVVHVDVPNSLEEYYQEAGRAGRDGKRSWAVMLVGRRDKSVLKRHVEDAFPEKTFIQKVYERVGNFLHVAVGDGADQMFDFNFNLFCKQFKLPVIATHSALRLLTQAGYIEFVEEIETQSRVMILATKEELYDVRSSDPNVDKVLQALLRTYTGLFSDYVFINESLLEFRYHIPQEDIYTALLTLTREHILHYVPRKRTPYIVYTASRMEPKYILMPKSIYQGLKEVMQQRIDAVIDYAYSEDECREVKLLTYFGENDVRPCGHCDVCIDKRKRNDHTGDDVKQGILYMAQVKPRKIEEFTSTLAFPKDEIYDTLSFLVDEGYIKHLDDDTYKNPVPLN